MSVEDKMRAATRKLGGCGTCDGRIRITRADFEEVADIGPDTDAQFEELVARATRGAVAKCNGCDVVVVEREYNKQTLDGVIRCKGHDTSGVPATT